MTTVPANGGLQRPFGNLISPLWCSVSSIKMRGLGYVVSKSFKECDCFLKHLGPLTVHLLYAIATQRALQTFSYLTLMTSKNRQVYFTDGGIKLKAVKLLTSGHTGCK